MNQKDANDLTVKSKWPEEKNMVICPKCKKPYLGSGERQCVECDKESEVKE